MVNTGDSVSHGRYFITDRLTKITAFPVEERVHIMGMVTHEIICGIGRHVSPVYIRQGSALWRE